MKDKNQKLVSQTIQFFNKLNDAYTKVKDDIKEEILVETEAIDNEKPS